MTIRIELFGIARARAGRAEVEVEAETVAEALAELGRAVPALAEAGVIEGGALGRGWLLSIDGERFVDAGDASLSAGGRLLLIPAQAGG